ncbi:eva-1 homolog Bb [Eucyclogobius newberryi]|uniref:eva-1 homolog Bb n=1 Tax=Eucyclogobius newberryi TaxID=166745 RepID=UPI003B5C19F9
MEPIRRDMELISNTMATFAHLRANPESLALFFMLGVCLGLFSALLLLIAGITCRRRLHRNNNTNNNNNKRTSPAQPATPPDLYQLHQLRESSAEEASQDSAPEADAALGLAAGRSGEWGGALRGVDVFASEEELEKARRLEQREKILREIWRNGQPDVLVSGTGTIGRVHYH